LACAVAVRANVNAQAAAAATLVEANLEVRFIEGSFHGVLNSCV
jgi:hypothetical protein